MTIKVFRTLNETQLFEEMLDVSQSIPASITVSLDPKKYGQVIDGFGASFTDSSAFLIDKVLNESQKREVMLRLFDAQEGIGLSLLRNPMGASDFARSIYSYDDQPKGASDSELCDFSIAHDEESILPLTQWAQRLNPALKLFASPWSAPGWMKTSDSMMTGQLEERYYNVYAEYFVRFIQAYEEAGVEVYAVTPQNEPLFEPSHYPSMYFPAHDEARFVKDFLKPAFQKAGICTKIFGYDHNWDRIDYAFDLLDQAEAAFDGIAWHWYGGRSISQKRVETFFPQKEVHFTEGSGGDWVPAFEPAFSNLMRTGIDIIRNGSKSFVLWNIALDEQNGPTVPGFGRSTCRGLLKIHQEEKTVAYTLDYYGLAHFSKFIRPGAQRLETQPTESIRNVAVENLDGSLVWVLFNDSNKDHTVAISNQEQILCTVPLPAKAAATVRYS